MPVGLRNSGVITVHSCGHTPGERRSQRFPGLPSSQPFPSIYQHTHLDILYSVQKVARPVHHPKSGNQPRLAAHIDGIKEAICQVGEIR